MHRVRKPKVPSSICLLWLHDEYESTLELGLIGSLYDDDLSDQEPKVTKDSSIGEALDILSRGVCLWSETISVPHRAETFRSPSFFMGDTLHTA